MSRARRLVFAKIYRRPPRDERFMRERSQVLRLKPVATLPSGDA